MKMLTFCEMELIGLIGESFFDPNNLNFEYTGDTLQITILDIIDGKYLVEEVILPNSTIFTEDKNYIDKSKVANQKQKKRWFSHCCLRLLGHHYHHHLTAGEFQENLM